MPINTFFMWNKLIFINLGFILSAVSVQGQKKTFNWHGVIPIT
jgi:hypothetical protein